VEYDLDRFDVGCENDEFTDTSVEGLCGFVGSVCQSKSSPVEGYPCASASPHSRLSASPIPFLHSPVLHASFPTGPTSSINNNTMRESLTPSSTACSEKPAEPNRGSEHQHTVFPLFHRRKVIMTYLVGQLGVGQRESFRVGSGHYCYCIVLV